MLGQEIAYFCRLAGLFDVHQTVRGAFDLRHVVKAHANDKQRDAEGTLQ